jgi:hypothetical protein
VRWAAVTYFRRLVRYIIAFKNLMSEMREKGTPDMELKHSNTGYVWIKVRAEAATRR